jgi:hypothetical protein
MNEQARTICEEWFDKGCRKSCPLAEACKTQPGDNPVTFSLRMNEAAAKLQS